MIEWIKKNLVLAIVIAIALGVVGLVGGIKVADMPFFCGMLCHEMQPHVDSLAANFHGKNGVICMDCHSKQGFINHTLEHMVSAKLMIPHLSKVYLEDEHGRHKDVKGFNAEEMNFRGKVDSPVEEEMFKKCLTCHPERLSKSYYMKAVHHMEEVVTANCKRCHTGIAGSGIENAEEAKKLLTNFEKPLLVEVATGELVDSDAAKRLTDARELFNGFTRPQKLANVHPLHIGKDILCVKCHNRVVHSNHPQKHTPTMDVCFACHNKGGKAPEVECPVCHIGQANLFAGVKAKDIAESPAFMKDIACTDCHINNMKFDVSACVGCHDDSYKDKLAEFKNNYKTKFEAVSKQYEEINKALEEGKSLGQAAATFKRATFNFKYAGNDGSKGMHNPDFTDALLTKSQEDFTEVQKALK
ncbi:ammonia-forming cytochrome c nitrite reductase subunit c552 [Candidatus Poribacteria bacterium]|nr:ammonia-forming cytochrome c nitrite reductase subunit c552 [Candidatus Poribacteria bacterium]